MRHKEGDIVRVRDCVLLRSGPKKTDLPFVAKIAALWEDPETCKVYSCLPVVAAKNFFLMDILLFLFSKFFFFIYFFFNTISERLAL